MLRRALRLVLACALAVPASLAAERPALAAAGALYLPNVTKTLGGADGWTTPVAVQNTGSLTTTATLSFFRFADGAPVASVESPPLRPGHAWTFDPLAYASLPHDAQFSLLVQPQGGTVTAVVLEGAGTSWMSYAGSARGAPKVYLPNVTRRLGGADGWETPFVVQNLGSDRASATVSFYRFADGTLAHRIDGVAIDPGRSRAFIPAAVPGLADDTQYSVVVEGAPTSSLYAVVNEHYRGEAMSYEGLLDGGQTVYLPNVTKHLGGVDRWSTPFIVQNIGAAPATFTLEFYAFATGTLALRTPPASLLPGRSFPVDVRSAPADLSPGQYAVVVRGSPGARLGAVVNQMDLIAGRSMSYNAIAGGEPTAYVPVLRKRSGSGIWSSPVIAQNLGALASDVTITVIDGAGNVASQRAFRGVAPGAAAVYDPRMDVCLLDGSYSAIVQASTAVAAVVNHTGEIAGDVALSFTSAPGAAVVTPPAPPALPRTVAGMPFAVTCTVSADVYAHRTLTTADAQTILASVDPAGEAIEREFGRRFRSRATVYAFGTTTAYRAGLTSIFRLNGPEVNAPGLYLPSLNAVAIDGEKMEPDVVPFTIVRHELTHQMVHEIVGAREVPAWLNEGAARLGEHSVEGARWRAMDSRYSAASMAATGTLLTLEQMTSQEEWNARAVPMISHQYEAAAQAVALLVSDIGQGGVVGLLDVMSKGYTFEAAYEAMSRRTFASFAGSYAARVGALAERYPGVATAPDTVRGPGLSIMWYGFAPSTTVTLTIRSDSGTGYSTTSQRVNTIGTGITRLGDTWPPGTYTITVQGANGTATTSATKP